jgi:hypothetical protein
MVPLLFGGVCWTKSELSLSKIQRILSIDPPSVSARLRFAGEPPIFMPAKLAHYQFQN